MSKSNDTRRRSYCTASTRRTGGWLPPRATACAQRRPLEFVARGLEQGERPLEVLAVTAGAIGTRRRPGAVEHVGTHRVGERCKQGAFARIRRTVIGGQLRAGKE